MTKRDKLKLKFCRIPPPKDFKFEDLVTMLSGMGFIMYEQSGGSSHKYFILVLENGDELRIDTAKPHPHNVLKTYQIKEISDRLKEWGLL